MGKKVETVTDFIFLDSKITADDDCSHEIKRHLLLGRKAMTNLGSILKSRYITLLTKVMRKEARHTQRRDRASGVPLEILEHIPPKPESAYFLLVLSPKPLTLRGTLPHYLSLKKPSPIVSLIWAIRMRLSSHSNGTSPARNCVARPAVAGVA